MLPFEEVDEAEFFRFLYRDKVLHIFTIYDLQCERDKTKVWVAFKNNRICGYLFEFNKRIVHTHGAAESLTKLLHRVDLDELTIIIEPQHLTTVKKFFTPVEPTDPSSRGKITTYLVMKSSAQTFKPSIKHRVKRLRSEDLSDVLKHLGKEWKERVEKAIRRGFAFGAYHKGLLASVATVPEIIDNIALIRGVYTVPSLRGRGLATTASSALVEELIKLGKEVVLWVAKDNKPARKVYEKIGFEKTKHILLGFKAKRPTQKKPFKL